MFRKATDVIVPPFDGTLCLLMLLFFKLPRFPFLLLLLVNGRRMIYLFIFVNYISSPFPTPTPTPIEPPITQVFYRGQNPPVANPTLVASSSDPVHSDDLPITLHKVKR